MDKVYTVNEVAAILGRSRRTIIRLFEDMPGIVDLSPAQERGKRRYRSLGIPRSTLTLFLAQRSTGGTITIKFSKRSRKRK